jgi:chromosome segregation ATPase
VKEQLASSQSKVVQLERELEKTDKILREHFGMLDVKKREKQALKSELELSRRGAGEWQTRYNQLLAAHQELTKVAAESKDAKKALQKSEASLKSMQDERSQVKEKLQIGGAAFRRVKVLETVKAEDDRKISLLQEQTTAQAQRIKLLEQELASLKNQAGAAAGEKVTLKTVQGELASVKEKLRTSSMEVLANTQKLSACAAMLTKTDQVLKICSLLHAGKEGSESLSKALNETSSNVGAFLASLRPT